MKVKDVIVEKRDGVISIYNDNECVKVLACHQKKLQRFLERDVISAESRGGNLYIEIQ